MLTVSHQKHSLLKKAIGRYRVRLRLVTAVFGLAFLLATTATIATAAPPNRPAAAGKALAKQVAPLECTAFQFSAAQVTLPALDAAATLTLRNTASSSAILVKPGLSFAVQTAKDNWRDVSTSIYVEPDAANAWFIAPGQSAQFKFKVQLLHDTPAGRLRVLPRVEYFSQSDNAFPQLAEFGKNSQAWQVDNPAQKFNAAASLVKTEAASLGAENVVQLAVQDNRLKGRITLQSPKSTLRPNTDYVAGVFFKSDRSGWDSPINKGAAITEYDDKGAVRAHPMHLFEVPYWSWELTRFKSDAKATQADMALWNRGWALGQRGQSWYGAAFLVPAAKLRVVDAAALAPVVNVTAAVSPNIAFLGDDRPKPGEGGDWIGRYGNKSFILCGMQAPQDVVGGRFLPKRRWVKGRDGFAPTAPVWTDWKGEFFYEVLTGDPKEPPRHWIPINELTTQDSRALVNPLEGGRRYSSWDDRGEVRPFDGKGPDLIVNLEIPQGPHRLTLYFIDWDFYNTGRPRAHRLFFSDAGKDEKSGLLSSGYVSDFGQGIYKVYGVSGPSKLRLRIQKDKSVCAVLSGIFLDEINLPDVQRILLAQSQRSAPLQQAVQTYEALRQLQNTPEKFLNAGEQAKVLLRKANQLARSATKDEAAVGEWLRWQITGSLVVAPWVKEPAFRNYLAARPAITIAAARMRVQGLLGIGEIGAAKQASQVWFQTARGEPLQELAALREAITWFAQRDTDFACILAHKFVQQSKEQRVGIQAIADYADKFMNFARMQAEGSLQAQNSFRVAAEFYRAIEKEFDAALDDTDAFRFAEATANSPGYYLVAEKRALEAYRKYLQQWPRGSHSVQAHKRIISLVHLLATPAQKQARQYIRVGAESAQDLLLCPDESLQSSLWISFASSDTDAIRNTAFKSIHQLIEVLDRIGDKQEAGNWRTKVIERIHGQTASSQPTQQKSGT